MAVSLAISEIFSIKEWPDHELWVVQGHLKSRGSTDHVRLSIGSAIVAIALFCTIFKLFDVD